MKQATKYIFDKIIDFIKFFVGNEVIREGRRKYSFAKFMIRWFTITILPFFLLGYFNQASFVRLFEIAIGLTLIGFFAINGIEHGSKIFRKKNESNDSPFNNEDSIPPDNTDFKP